MASSRWKRFAFFERSSLTIPPEVIEDLIPALGGGRSVRNNGSNTTISTGNNSRRSIRTLDLAGQVTADDGVSWVVTTAALPVSSSSSRMRNRDARLLNKKDEPSTTMSGEKDKQSSSLQQGLTDDAAAALEAMWSSWTACTSAGTTSDEVDLDPTSVVVSLPSQGQIAQQMPPEQQQHPHPPRTGDRPGPSADGLVLVFASSQDTEFVHCLDVTMRCNPPKSAEATTTNDWEELDGWRGYLAPFSYRPNGTSSGGQLAGGGLMGATGPSQRRSSYQDAIIAEHMENTASATQPCIIALAVCRDAQRHRPVYLACLSQSQLVVVEDPHLNLSCRVPLTTPPIPKDVVCLTMPNAWNTQSDGMGRVVDIVPGMVAVGSSTGVVQVFLYQASLKPGLRPYLRIPSPPAGDMEVVAVKISLATEKAQIFAAYQRSAESTATTNAAAVVSSAGICCYDVPLPGSPTAVLSAPSARHDLDGRQVGSNSLVDVIRSAAVGENSPEIEIAVARPDGIYSYSATERTGVAPIDGTKLAICVIPPAIPAEKVRPVDPVTTAGHVVVASTDARSGRDSIDIYDCSNKLVAFHILLSPGHKAVRAAGISTQPLVCADGSVQGGRASAVVLTSGGSLVTFTEKLTAEKVSLLVQKNLYSAAIVIAYADPSFEASEITSLYQRYAEHLYRKSDFGGAIEQYMHTIGSLESSHVIFRFLDAPKIPMLVKYLEKLRTRDLATPVHRELLRTCYLKLNDMEAAEAIAASGSRNISQASLTSILTNLSTSPKEALATICTLDAQQAAEVLVIHGASLARALPRETAGVVVSLCVGSYSPKLLADAAQVDSHDLRKMIDVSAERAGSCEPFPVQLFAPAFIEQPKMLRLILAHCNRNRCPLTPSLRRTLLELTLAEWNQAKRSGDTEAQKLRQKEAITALTDSHCRDIGDYDALLLVQLADFPEGELLLYERLQMTPMLLERYAKDGTAKSRRQMLALCQTDPEVLADVLGHFVAMVAEKSENRGERPNRDDDSEEDEIDEIMEDIQQALALARRQGVLPPVRVARILAGEGAGQFSTGSPSAQDPKNETVPLAVALQYVSTILEESRRAATRLRAEVEEYNQLCNSMETEIESLVRASQGITTVSADLMKQQPVKPNIDELYTKVREGETNEQMRDQPREAFWREMDESEDSFDTICRYFARGALD